MPGDVIAAYLVIEATHSGIESIMLLKKIIIKTKDRISTKK